MRLIKVVKGILSGPNIAIPKGIPRFPVFPISAAILAIERSFSS